MIENGKIKVSYEKVCEILRELDIILDSSHTTVEKLRALKEEHEVELFRSDIIWGIITLDILKNPISFGEVERFINHAFPDIDFEHHHELLFVYDYIRPILKQNFPNLEKYKTRNGLYKNFGQDIEVRVIKTGIKGTWRNDWKHLQKK